jgi:hypothetical protein
VKSGGFGLGKLGPAGEKYADQIKKVQDDIASGKITTSPTRSSSQEWSQKHPLSNSAE